MLDLLIIGFLQGILEWLPVSSQGVISSLLQNWGYNLKESVDIALFLHLGTLCATISFFWNDLKRVLNPKTTKDLNILSFISWSTLFSLIIAAPFYILINLLSVSYTDKGELIVGSLLIITGLLQVLKHNFSKRGYKKVEGKDGILTGLAQGFSVLPGISRSGTTTLALLINGLSIESALRLSFFASIPVIFIAQLATGLMNGFFFKIEYLLAAFTAFIVGRFSIKYLLKIAKNINFASFCVIFGIITILF